MENFKYIIKYSTKGQVMEKIKKLNTVTAIVIIGFLIAISYHYILGTVFHLGYPFNTYLFGSYDSFKDFLVAHVFFKKPIFNPYIHSIGIANYFPFGMFVFFIFSFFNPFISLILFLLFCIIYFVIYNYSNIKQNLLPEHKFNGLISLFVISFLSYPFLFALDRANYELLVFVFVSLSIYFFVNKKFLASALTLSLPIAIKGYPLIFLAFLFLKKKFKEIFYCLVIVFILTIIPLLIAKGGFVSNIQHFLVHMSAYKRNYIFFTDGLVYNSSLFGIVKLIVFWINGSLKLLPLSNHGFESHFYYVLYSFNDKFYKIFPQILKIYTLITAITTFLVFAYTAFIEKQIWKKVLLIIICSIILPPVSGDYKLLLLYIPLWMFINSKAQAKTDLFYAVMFGLALIPKNYLQFICPERVNAFNISVVLNPLILLIIAVFVIVEGFCIYSKNKMSTQDDG